MTPFGRVRPIKSTLHLFTAIPSSKTFLPSFQTMALSPESVTRISAAVCILQNHRSKTRYNFLKSSFTGSTPVFTPPESVQIILNVRSKPHLALRFYNTPLCPKTLVTRSAIIHVTARARLKSHALSLIKSAIISNTEEYKDNDSCHISLFKALAETYRMCDSAPFVFDLLIKGYLHFNRIEPAIAIVRALRERKIEPQVDTSTLLIRLVCKFKGLNCGFDMYRELFSCFNGAEEIRSRALPMPNVRTFNILLVACYREGKLEVVDVIKKEMERFSCKSNVFSYSIQMAGFCDEGLIDKAMEVWDEMVSGGVKPDLMSFNVMIKGYCECEEMKKAEELFKEMGLSGISPSGATFNSLISGYCRIKDVDSGLVLYKDMERFGFGMESVVMDELIEVLIEDKKVHEGLEILRDEMRSEVFEASKKAYELLIKGFCEEGKMEMALRLQAEMAGKGFGVSDDVYDDFVKGYRGLGDEVMAKRLEKEMAEMSMKKDGN